MDENNKLEMSDGERMKIINEYSYSRAKLDESIIEALEQQKEM
jgi:hypothetical protein